MTSPVKPTAAGNGQAWLVNLQAHGYRLTAPRRAVVEVISLSQHLLTPLDIFELARARYPRLGLVTVYRTVEKLEELGLIQRVHQPSGCQAFIAAFSGHQHLLICQRCGRVEFFSGDQATINTLAAEVSSHSGYAIEEHWLQLFGTCLICRETER
ncbi:MAG: Fur family transcriptional regulator [Anaerolineales bacterium]|nr:Fur family transcriptional regulator [Anaerolineales bacterium]